jgi:hypothetical protein
MKKQIRTKKAIEADYRTKALHGGKRISEDGNVYYENRPNRSDENRTKKFEEGGGIGSEKEAIKADIEKAKRQMAIAEKNNVTSAVEFSKKKIARLEKELEEAEKAPVPSPEKKEESKKPAMPVKKAKAVKVEPKPKAKVPVKKEKPAKKVSVPVKKEKATATKKEKKFVEIDGKKYYEDTKEFCDALNIAWDKRKQAIKKANKAYKTKTISERIGGGIASIVVKSIDHVADIKEAQIAKNPDLYITKFEKLEDSANTFAKAIKDLLGSEYDSSEVKSELEEIEKAIDKIKSKVKK